MERGNMKFQEFLEKWNGKYIDFDGVYGNQCMDEMHQYCVEVLGISDGSVLAAPCAKDVYNNFENIKGHELFEKIPNTPEGVPQEGDILFWGNGTWGHVAVFVDGGVNSFNSFDQNYPTGSPCHIQSHNYSSVLGWLRCKNIPTDNDLLKSRADAFVSVCTALGKPIDKDVVLADIQRLLTLEQKVMEKEKEIVQKSEEIKTLDQKLQELSTQNNQLSTTLEEIRREQADMSWKLKDAQDEIEKLKEIKPLTNYSLTELVGQMFKKIFGR